LSLANIPVKKQTPDMKGRTRYIWFFLLGLILLVDPAVYWLLDELAGFESWLYPALFWAIPLVLVVWLMLLVRFNAFYARKPRAQKRYFIFFGAYILFYVPKLFFLVPALAENLVNFAIERVSFYAIEIRIFSWFFLFIGILLFLLILYGILFGRFHYKVERVNISDPLLPQSFDSFRIAHISDLHIGSWVGNEKKLAKAVDRINREKPDMIVFTGDLFNNYYEEINGFSNILGRLEAPFGKYAVLGNHDYGDYFYWSDEQERRENVKKMRRAYEETGFHLLCNNSVVVQRNGDGIGLAGVENWGLPPFHQYGNLQEALSGLNGSSFNILLSHDPSHWKAEILKNPNVQLTLSGHTHAMQFGIYTRWLKWSPVKAKYPEWGGLYQNGRHLLYVNKGLGFIGFPGRVGIRPEITLLTLKKN
jgi:hypothetical protein